MSTDEQSHQLESVWVAHLDNQGKSRHTISAYVRSLRHFIKWSERRYQEGFSPSRVLPRDIRHWIAYQQTREHAAPSTINLRLTGVSRFFDWAISQGHTTENPTADINTLRLPDRAPKALSERDLSRLLRQAKDNLRDYAIIEMLVGTGLRVGELLDLQISDVELGERSGKVIVRRGKHGQYREVPLVLDVRKALSSYLNTIHPDLDNPKAPIWLNRRHKALKHRSSILRLLEKYARHAGLTSISPHMLRHTFASRYLQANPGDLRGLARLLGHSSLNTVMIYTEPTLADLAERMERVDS